MNDKRKIKAIVFSPPIWRNKHNRAYTNVIRNSEARPKQKYLYKSLIPYNNIKEETL